ncbi:hypothetical protein AWC38_SpisGene16120 [Stylophora pistillata]|uniref:Transcription termination factor 3, mitochondrial n=1 Tax=Stylophora pistillata TaxID=50429 RepID=A0A2B4RRQ9_STYPI|nr:hypothetical protein AWC38_SpisGene16120 [Stylophora pistillata]
MVQYFFFRTYRYFTTPGLGSAVSTKEVKVSEKGLSVDDDSQKSIKKDDLKFPRHWKAKTQQKVSRSQQEIPSHKDLNLYRYVKKLETTLGRGKGSISKRWSYLLTKYLKAYNKLTCSTSLLSESPRILGLTPKLLEERLNFLFQIGITGRDALIIALEFPAILSWDSPNFTEMLKVLKDLNCDIVALMFKTPFVFSLDQSRVQENIHKLTSAGIAKNIIGKIISNNPLLLSFPLREQSLEIISLLLDSHKTLQSELTGKGVKEEEAILNLILHSAEKFKEQVDFQENFKEVISFLEEMEVSPLIIAVTNPVIFSTDVDTLSNSVAFLRSKPLLLDMEAVQHLLITKPEIFVNLDSVKNRIQLLYDIVQNPTVLYSLVKTRQFLFDSKNSTVEAIIKWFQGKGIKNKEIAHIMTAKNFFFLEKDELDEKLDYLLSNDGVEIEDVIKHPSCLLKPIAYLKERVEFVKAVKPEVLNNRSLDDVMVSKNELFSSEVCGSTLENYTKFVQSLNKELAKAGKKK